MRISDWSSDVCSSDLRSGTGRNDRQRRNEQIADDREPQRARGDHRILGYRADRKSVVEGKSVSVRVDLGGRRIIKKQKNNQTRNNKKQLTSKKKKTNIKLTHNNTTLIKTK